MSIPDPIVLLDARARYVHPAFQMSRASVKSAFDDKGQLRTIPVNAIGWQSDAMTGRRKGVLIEPPRTNFVTHANDFTQPSWGTVGASVVAGAARAPDGTMTMAKLVEDATNTEHRIFEQIATVTAPEGVVSGSIYLKPEERSRANLYIRNQDGLIVRADFDLHAGEIGAVTENGGTLHDFDVVPVGDGVFWCWIAAQFPDFTGGQIRLSLLGDGAGYTYQGDGTSGLYIWGGQLEEGPYATSLIQTNGAAATRPADDLRISNLDGHPWWRAAAGTVVADIHVNRWISGGSIWSFANQLRLDFRGDQPDLIVRGGNMSGFVIAVPGGSGRLIGRQRVAIAWDGDSVGVSGNGAPVASGPQTSPLTASTLNINFPALSFHTHANIQFERLAHYPQRLSDADLQSLTAIQE